MNSKDVVALVGAGGALATALVLFYSLFGLPALTLAEKTAISDLTGSATMGLSGIALVFLGFSLVQRNQYRTSERLFNLYSMISFTLFLLVPLCVLDAILSVCFRMLKSDLLISFSLSLFLVIGEIIIASSTVIVYNQIG